MMKKCFSFAAEAKHRIELVTLVEAVDDMGGQSTTSESTETVFARVRPATGFERLQGERVDSRVTHKILIRYRADMAVTGDAAKKFLRVEGRDLNIHYVRNLDHDLKTEGRYFQEIYAVEGERGAV